MNPSTAPGSAETVAAIDAWMIVLFESSIRGVILVLVAALAAWFLRGRAASLRHAVWLFCLIGFLVLPGMILAGPRVSLDLPDVLSPVQWWSAYEQQDTSARTFGERLSEWQAEQELGGTSASHTTGDPQDQLIWLFIAWAVGASIAMACLLFEAIGIKHLCARSVPASASLERWVVGAAQEAKIKRSCHVLVSDEITSPLVAGWFKPLLIMPVEAEQWTRVGERPILVHELAHIKRFDCLTSLAGYGVCILHWFNPVVWVAFGYLSLERERAADQTALWGEAVQPSVYATLLLRSIGRSPHSPPRSVAGSAGFQNHLESRIRSVLSNKARKDQSNSGRMTTVGIVALLTAALLAIPIDRAEGRGAFDGWACEALEAEGYQLCRFAPAEVLALRPRELAMDSSGRLIGARSMDRDDVMILLNSEIGFFVKGRVEFSNSLDWIHGLQSTGYLVIEITHEKYHETVAFAAEPTGKVLFGVWHDGKPIEGLHLDQAITDMSEAIAAMAHEFDILGDPRLARLFSQNDRGSNQYAAVTY